MNMQKYCLFMVLLFMIFFYSGIFLASEREGSGAVMIHIPLREVNDALRKNKSVFLGIF